MHVTGPKDRDAIPKSRIDSSSNDFSQKRRELRGDTGAGSVPALAPLGYSPVR